MALVLTLCRFSAWELRAAGWFQTGHRLCAVVRVVIGVIWRQEGAAGLLGVELVCAVVAALFGGDPERQIDDHTDNDDGDKDLPAEVHAGSFRVRSRINPVRGRCGGTGLIFAGVETAAARCPCRARTNWASW